MKQATIIILVLLLTACGDQKAKDRAAASRAEAEAYTLRQQTNALSTAVAVSSENNRLAHQALATQAAIANQYTAQTLQPAQPPQATGGGFDLASLAPILALVVTIGLSGLSLLVSLAAAQRRPAQVIYVTDEGQVLDVEQVLELPEPKQVYLRPIPAGQSRARLLRSGK